MERALADERASIDSARRVVESDRVVLAAEREALAEERERLEAWSRSMDAQREALASLRTSLDDERTALTAERAAVAAQQARSGSARGQRVEEVLEARGLRGADEFERALVALAQGRHLRDVLWTLRSDAPDQLARVLDDKLLLVGGTVADAMTRGTAVVAVAPDRAELPGGAELSRRLSALSERIMLHGLRRVVVAGGRARWHRVLREGLDPRLEVRLAGPGPRTRAMALEDAGWADLVVLWDVDVDPAAEGVYAAARATVVHAHGTRLVDLVDAVVEALGG
ncbi:MAG: hypothetical protein H6733_15865 [Alphaproteobacteria bacterium]|nr:hypothetical protein [Alphaproteobacteria bacterium]